MRLELISELVQSSLANLGTALTQHGEHVPVAVKESLEAAVEALKEAAKAEWAARHEPAVDYFLALREAVATHDAQRTELYRDRLVEALDAAPGKARLKARNRLVGMPLDEYSAQFLVNLEFLIFGGRVVGLRRQSEARA
jgi:hypothetical protein